jgi:hypothetical protein
MQYFTEYLKKIGWWWTVLALPIIKRALGFEGDIDKYLKTLNWYTSVSAIPEWVWWAVPFLVFLIVNCVIFINMRVENERIIKAYEDNEKKKAKWDFTEQLRMSKVAWGLWFTGTIPWSDQAYNEKQLTRLLVVEPDSEGYKEAIKVCNE